NCTVRSKVTPGISSTGCALAGAANAAAESRQAARRRIPPTVPRLTERLRARNLPRTDRPDGSADRLRGGKEPYPMRKLVYLAVLLAALVAAGYAVADGFRMAASPAAVAGTFSAAQVSTSSRTCTTGDGRTIVVTDGTYKGSASGDATLSGAITVRAHSVVDTTNKIGIVNGRFGIHTSSGPDTTAAFQGVWSNGQLAGLATGRVHRRQGFLVGNVSADFDPATGFTNARIGGGTSGGMAVLQTPRACKQQGSKPEHSAAVGTISTLSS